MSESILKADRLHLYRDPQVQLLLYALTENNIQELKPTIDQDGAAHFPAIENIMGLSPEENIRLLNTLAYTGIVTRQFYQRLICCPRCGEAPRVFIRHSCTSCNSSNLTLVKKVRHLKCGGISVVSNPSPATLCSLCTQPLGGADSYTVIETTIKCNECSSLITEVFQVYYCSNCQKEFSLSEAYLQELYSYALNEKILGELRRNLTLPQLKQALTRGGFIVQMPGWVSGTSGEPKNFTLIAERNGQLFAVDFLQGDEEVPLADVVSFYAKISDWDPRSSFLIASPRLTAEARAFLRSKHIFFLETGDRFSARSVCLKLKSRIENIFHSGDST